MPIQVRGTTALAIVLLAVAGCGGGASTPNVDGSKYLLESEPAGAQSVIDARKNSKDGEEIVLVGRIGGSVDPWVEGRAAFSVVDSSLKHCKELGHKGCPHPWDFC